MLGGTDIEVNERKCNITPGIQKVFTDSSYNTVKPMNDTNKVVFRDFLQKTDFYFRIPSKRRMSGDDRYIKSELDKELRRLSKLDTKLRVKELIKLSYHPT